MHHQAEARIVLHAEVVQCSPGLRRVVLLVEDQGAGIGGETEIHEPGQRRQGAHDDCRRPARARSVGPKSGPIQRSGLMTGTARCLRLEVVSRDGHCCNRRL